MYKEFENAQPEAIASAVRTRRCDRIVCANTVLAFLAVLFTFTLGLIVGILLTDTLSPNLPVIVTLAIVFAVLMAIMLILRFCMRERSCCNRRC